MLTEFLSLLCLGLSLGFEDEKKNEMLPKPTLSALPSNMVEHRGNVSLRCQSHFQNVTFMLGKLQDSGYRQEQRSTGHEAEFLLTHLEPKDAGMYFCAYKTMVSQEWSEESEHLWLQVKDNDDGRGAPAAKKLSESLWKKPEADVSLLPIEGPTSLGTAASILFPYVPGDVQRVCCF
ncbi:V-set and transmembrane domain-containing protein 1 isoform X3 [Canis lupus familiaris]|uniref:V-set and transmembrane domain-containing protein 1 isoform X3 n=1 Tax=Canis lupus familiaris TaxID=9615 RepID=UPI0015F19633|nr:V-set and transmembrane domain-containing protein 1 isoform X3 [Canis lupus familiaris]XP_038503656.1 V-set and transmembrane domain-containing protein 1 isoform X3 [Canis lupus familiaris]XP_038511905.1 V-set and transmembrane domain-containing protein 1 isoform X3 [Canis lupus familiaris]